eukprot:Hpha_TRINITY_DN16245_c2_g6::TRINITY_DN16245_c2_g6_i1::g.11836::m.11836/K17278/PGRMC1_2; membrane-associated progesterone receptor component
MPEEEEEELSGLLDAVVAFALLLAALVYWISSVRRKRWEKKQHEEWMALRKKMHVDTRDDWTPELLRPYTGGPDDDQQPILIVAKEIVYNVWRGREFYGDEMAYHLFAGRDATRFLARELLDEEDEEEAKRPLMRDELSVLDEWISTFQFKYDEVGTMAPGASLWSQEANKRAEWQVFTSRYTTFALAAAVVVGAAVTATHIPDPSARVKARRWGGASQSASALSVEERLRQRAAEKGTGAAVPKGY